MASKDKQSNQPTQANTETKSTKQLNPQEQAENNFYTYRNAELFAYTSKFDRVLLYILILFTVILMVNKFIYISEPPLETSAHLKFNLIVTFGILASTMLKVSTQLQHPHIGKREVWLLSFNAFIATILSTIPWFMVANAALLMTKDTPPMIKALSQVNFNFFQEITFIVAIPFYILFYLFNKTTNQAGRNNEWVKGNTVIFNSQNTIWTIQNIATYALAYWLILFK